MDIVTADVKEMKVFACRGRVDFFLRVLLQIESKVCRLCAGSSITLLALTFVVFFLTAGAFVMALLPPGFPTLSGRWRSCQSVTTQPNEFMNRQRA